MIECPYRTAADILRYAESFLKKYHPSLELPIPIDDIVEIEMGFAVSPVNGIKTLSDCDGCISISNKEIFVDAQIYQNIPTRARFTVAHEIGHYEMHKPIYEAQSISTFDDYLNFQNAIDSRNYNKIEFQAYRFAGLVLVPPEPLKRIIKETTGRVQFSFEELPGLEGLINKLTEVFDVSSIVIMKRLQEDGYIPTPGKI